MKVLHFFLLFAVLALASAIGYNEDTFVECKKEKNCYNADYEPVCAKASGRAGTYNNKCESDCEKAAFLHTGRCTYNDMLNNKQT